MTLEEKRLRDRKYGEAFRKRHGDRLREYKRQWQADYLVANREKVNEHRRIRRATNPEQLAEERKRRRDLDRERLRLWRFRFPMKARAHWIVSNALKKGELERKHCLICGSSESQAHHEDYSKPLEITWLCPFHHSSQHSKIK